MTPNKWAAADFAHLSANDQVSTVIHLLEGVKKNPPTWEAQAQISLDLANHIGMVQAALLQCTQMHRLSDAYTNLSIAIGHPKATFKHYRSQQTLPLHSPITYPDGTSVQTATLMRTKEEEWGGGQKRSAWRVMDMIHFPLPHEPSEEIKKVAGWVGSPEALIHGKDRSMGSVILDRGHEFGRLWDITDGQSFLNEKVGPGFRFAARTTEGGRFPEFHIGDQRFRLPEHWLSVRTIQKMIDRRRGEIEESIARHCEHPAGATIPGSHVLVMHGSPVEGLRPYENGDMPKTFLDAIAPTNGQPATKYAELRLVDPESLSSDTEVTIQAIEGPQRLQIGDMLGLAFGNAEVLVRARIKKLLCTTVSALTEDDAVAVGFATKELLRESARRAKQDSEKKIALITLEALGRQTLPTQLKNIARL